jgi:hypothetical protein
LLPARLMLQVAEPMLLLAKPISLVAQPMLQVPESVLQVPGGMVRVPERMLLVPEGMLLVPDSMLPVPKPMLQEEKTMLQEYDLILRRLLATKAVQQKVAGVWIWEEKNLRGWEMLRQAMEQGKETLDLGEAALALLDGTLQAAHTTLHEKTKQIGGLAKVRFRKDPIKRQAFVGLRAIGTTVVTTRRSADNLAAAWAKADPTGSYVGTDLNAYNALRTALGSAQSSRETEHAGVRQARKDLDALLVSVHGDLVAWYAAATRVFTDATPEGQLLRVEIPTV